MNNRLLAGLALLMLAALARADEHPVSMWQIEGDTNRVYLLGSIHLLRADDHPLPAVVEAAYADAESLIMELDMDDIDPVALQSLTSEYGLIAGDGSLRELMGEARYQQAATAAERIGVPLDMLARTEPWLAAITVEQLILTRIGFNPAYGIEMHMTTKAVEDQKPVTGLETIEEQLKFLDNLSLDAQISLLLQTLEEGAELDTGMDDMVRAWREGDTDYLEDEMLVQLQNYPELYQVIVAKRNRRWLASIEALLDDEDDYLIVVGALHLVGDDGVPELLKKRGLRVRQMHETF